MFAEMDDFPEPASYFELLNDALNEKNQLFEEAEKKASELLEHIIISKEASNRSQKNIETLFSQIETVIGLWKKEFTEDLEFAFRNQHFKLLEEKQELNENIKNFNIAVAQAEVCLKNQGVEQEDAALSCLITLTPIIENLKEKLFQKVDSFQPVEFIGKKDFLEELLVPENKNKIGHIQCQVIGTQSLRLELREQPCIGSYAVFTVRVPVEHDAKSIMEHISLKIDAGENEVRAECFCYNRNIRLEFCVTANVVHEVSFYLYSQHIKGSPCRFMPRSTKQHRKPIVETKEDATPVTTGAQEKKPLQNALLLESVISPRTSKKLVERTTKDQVVLKKIPVRSKLCFMDLTKTLESPAEVVVDSNADGTTNMASGSNPVKKLVDRRIQISDPALRRPLRRPFIHLDDEKKVDTPSDKKAADTSGKTSCDAPAFRPSLTSTFNKDTIEGEIQKSDLTFHSTSNQILNNTADQTVTPGHKTIIIEEFLTRTLAPQSFNNSTVATFDRSDGFEYQREEESEMNEIGSQCGTSLDDNMENDSTCLDYVASPIKMEETSILLVKEQVCENEVMNGKDYQESEKLFISFLRARLTAKCSLFFIGNEKLQMNHPIGIAQLLNDNIVVGDTFNDRMLLFSKEGCFIRSFGCTDHLQQPSAIVVLPDGRFAVRHNFSVLIFSPECQFLEEFGRGYLKRPYGIAHDGMGNLVTIDTSFGGCMVIVLIDGVTGKQISRVTVKKTMAQRDAKLSKPRFIACQPPSTLLVVDLGLNLVYILNMYNGELIKSFGGSGSAVGKFNDPSGIVCDGDGYVLIGDSRNHRIQVFTPAGDFVCILEVDRPLKRPSGLCLTHAGDLLVLNYWENSFVKYSLCLKN